MGDRDFSIGSRHFKLHKIDTIKQFHIVRRIAPILSEMLPAMKDAAAKKVQDVESLPEDEKLDMVAKFASPTMNGLSRLSDSDSELVLFGLLNAVEIQQASGNWIRVAQPTMLMVQDLELGLLMQIAGRAFFYNLSGFFVALPQV
jgi:hypothetical protein